MGGNINRIFPKNFSRNFFANISFLVLSPLLGCQNVIYGGDTGGGPPSYCHKAIGGGGNYKVGVAYVKLSYKIIGHLFGGLIYYPYLCIVNVNNRDGFGPDVGGRRG